MLSKFKAKLKQAQLVDENFEVKPKKWWKKRHTSNKTKEEAIYLQNKSLLPNLTTVSSAKNSPLRKQDLPTALIGDFIGWRVANTGIIKNIIQDKRKDGEIYIKELKEGIEKIINERPKPQSYERPESKKHLRKVKIVSPLAKGRNVDESVLNEQARSDFIQQQLKNRKLDPIPKDVSLRKDQAEQLIEILLLEHMRGVDVLKHFKQQSNPERTFKPAWAPKY